MTKFHLIVALILSQLTISQVESSSSASANNEKLKHLMKNAKPNFKVKCHDLLKDFNPIVEERTFLVTSDQTSLISKHAKNSTFEKLSSECPSTIEANANRLELVWRYQFFESSHCIRVELDLGNLTQFRQVLNYNYYMFSYRELGSKNVHLKRQLIEDQTNGLTINRAHIKPYIVCVAFFKRDFSLLTRNHTVNRTTNQTMIDCRNFSQELLDDQKLQNVDLCIDIDTPAHFLSISQGHDGQGFHGVNRELMMVVFILCLTIIVLSTIATCRFIIDRPRKKRYKQLKDYLTKRTQNLFQSTGSHGSLNRDKLLGSNPSMFIVAHTNNLISDHGGSQQFEPSEGDALLPQGYSSNASLSSCHDESSPSNGSSGLTSNGSSAGSTALAHANHTHGKIHFSIGETILEEETSDKTLEEEAKPNMDINNDKKIESEQTSTNVGINGTSSNENGNNTGVEVNAESLEGTEEALKTVSHLLDDKPWSLARRDSKVFTVEKTNLTSVPSQARMNP